MRGKSRGNGEAGDGRRGDGVRLGGWGRGKGRAEGLWRREEILVEIKENNRK